MPEETKPPALGFHHNQIYVTVFAVIMAWAGSYLTARDQVTTMSVEIKTLKESNAKLEAALAATNANISKLNDKIEANAEKNQRYRDDMQETVTEMRIILGQRKR